MNQRQIARAVQVNQQQTSDALLQDQIVYQVVTNGGGIDGMDRSDKGGQIKFASFDRTEAEKHVTPWDTLKLAAFSSKELLDIKKKALKKLDGIDQLVLDLHPDVRAKGW